MQGVRPPAVAGLFYPADPGALGAEIDDLLGGAGEPAPRLGYPKAIVVPHAGFIYSGPIAARAYDEVAPGRGLIRRVVLLGPVHRVAVRGLALPGAASFRTPLGDVPVDAAAIATLHDLPQVVTSAPAHALEHSLEVQLPFLQKALGAFSIVPLAVGHASAAQVAEVLERLWGGPETLVVISTDLSHYHGYEPARTLDGRTIERIAALAPDLSHDEACGATPLNGALLVAKRRKLGVELLAACNSGDTAGGKDRVVGYSAFAMREPGAEVSLDGAGKILLAQARGAIEAALRGAAPAPGEAAWLGQCGATFVTLTRDGALRGCIGSLHAARPLGEDVAQNALGAAFRDPRFPAVDAAEWPRCSVEVSLLSSAKRLSFADEAELLEQIVAGEDGIVLECAGRRATFLPQVWESLPAKRDFLAQLLKKAGLPGDTRLAACRVSRYRVAKWKERDG